MKSTMAASRPSGSAASARAVGSRHAGLPGGLGLREDGLRQAEGGQQAPRRAVAHAGREGEAQPGGEFVALHALGPHRAAIRG